MKLVAPQSGSISLGSFWLVAALGVKPGQLHQPGCCARGGNIVLMVFRGSSGHFLRLAGKKQYCRVLQNLYALFQLKGGKKAKPAVSRGREHLPQARAHG